MTGVPHNWTGADVEDPQRAAKWLNEAETSILIAGGGGSITDITSTGGTVTITNPTGPTVNLEAATVPALSYSRAGYLNVAAGTGSYKVVKALTISGIKAKVATVPTGASVIVDVHKNGTTLFTTQGNRPTIAASATSSASEVPDVTALAVGDVITVDVDQVGSTVPGADLTVTVAGS